MVAKTVVENRANLSPTLFEPIARAVEMHRTIERALAWFQSQDPPLVPEDLVAQDEFSYDLLIPYPEECYLSYDTC